MIIDFDKNQVEIIYIGLKSLADKTIRYSENSQQSLKILYDEGHQDFQYDSINQGFFEINKKMQQYSLALQGFAGHLQNLINALQPYLNIFGSEIQENHAVLDSSVLRDCTNTLSHFLETINNSLTEFEKSLEFRKSRVNSIIERFKTEKDAAQKEVDYAQKEVNYASSNLSSCESKVYDMEVEYSNRDGSISSHTETVYPDCSYEQGCLDNANDELDRKIDILSAIAEKCNRAFEIYSEFEAVEASYFESKNKFLVILSKYQNALGILNNIIRSIYTFESTNFSVDSDARGFASKEYINSNGVNKLISENPRGIDIKNMKELGPVGHVHIWEKDGKKYVQIRNKSPEIYQNRMDNYNCELNKWEDQVAFHGLTDDLEHQKEKLKSLKNGIEKGHFYEYNTELISLTDILIREQEKKEYQKLITSLNNATNSELSDLKSTIIHAKFEGSGGYYNLKELVFEGKKVELFEENNFRFDYLPGECRMHNVRVPKELQRKGLGRKIVETIEKMARENGQHTITGSAENKSAKDFFLKMGYAFPKAGSYNFIKKL